MRRANCHASTVLTGNLGQVERAGKEGVGVTAGVDGGEILVLDAHAEVMGLLHQ